MVLLPSSAHPCSDLHGYGLMSIMGGFLWVGEGCLEEALLFLRELSGWIFKLSVCVLKSIPTFCQA